VSWDISEQVGQIIRSSFICPPIPATSHTQTLPASLRMTRQTIITILLLTSIKLFGQDTFEITGQVISKHGIPLTGTNIVLHKTTTGTIPNACGQFKIKIPKDKKGHLSFSMISLPFYFDLTQIKDEDLKKEIVFKIIPFDEDKGGLNKNKWKKNKTIECKKYKKKIVFKITEKNRQWPVDKD
jgi:hypothetical protein